MNYCTYMKIDNNIIRYGGQWVEQGCGILFQQGSYVNITHNDISNLYYTGISIGWVWGYSKTQTHHNLLLYNHIHHLGFQLLSDMGGIYHLGIDEGTHLSNNWIHNVDSSSYGGWGLYTDEGSSHVTLENNLVYNTSDGSFHQHYGNNNTVQNNIFAFSKSYILMGSRIEDHLSFISNKNILYYDKDELFSSLLYDESYQVTMDNNIYWNPLIKNATFNKQSFETYKNKYNRDKNSFVINPLFVNPENYDFHFRNEESIQKISFNKFEYTDAGVYGDNEWIQKANDYIVHEMFGYKPQLSLIDNFDRINKPIYYNLEGTKGYTYVTNKKSYSGTYSLALDSSTSSSLSIPPYFAYTVPSLSGNKTFSCWINAPKEAVLYIQVRDNSSPFVSSPSIRISNGNLLIGTGASQKTIEFIPDQWFKIYMNVGFGKYRTQNITLGAEINGNKTEVSQELNENFNLQKTMVFANTAALNYTVYFDDFYDVLETDEDEVENVPMPTPYVAPELVKGFISGMVLVCSIVVVIVVLIIVILIKRNK